MTTGWDPDGTGGPAPRLPDAPQAAAHRSTAPEQRVEEKPRHASRSAPGRLAMTVVGIVVAIFGGAALALSPRLRPEPSWISGMVVGGAHVWIGVRSLLAALVNRIVLDEGVVEVRQFSSCRVQRVAARAELAASSGW